MIIQTLMRARTRVVNERWSRLHVDIWAIDCCVCSIYLLFDYANWWNIWRCVHESLKRASPYTFTIAFYQASNQKKINEESRQQTPGIDRGISFSHLMVPTRRTLAIIYANMLPWLKRERCGPRSEVMRISRDDDDLSKRKELLSKKRVGCESRTSPKSRIWWFVAIKKSLLRRRFSNTTDDHKFRRVEELETTRGNFSFLNSNLVNIYEAIRSLSLDFGKKISKQAVTRVSKLVYGPEVPVAWFSIKLDFALWWFLFTEEKLT